MSNHITTDERVDIRAQVNDLASTAGLILCPRCQGAMGYRQTPDVLEVRCERPSCLGGFVREASRECV